MTFGATLVASLLVTLARPATWVLGLAALLIRGGILIVLAPILVLPTAVGLGNVVAPTLQTVVVSGVTTELALLGGAIVVAIATWLVAGGLFAALAELEAIEIVAADEDIPGGRRRSSGAGRARRARRILVARLIAHVPTFAALAWGATLIVGAAYAELTLPTDVVTPVALRVLRAVPGVIAVILLVWVLGETLGALAARRIALASTGALEGLRDALVRLVRHPAREIGLAVVPSLVMLVVVVPWILGARVAWGAVRGSLGERDALAAAFIVLLVFISIWLAGLLLTAVLAAWRMAVWTVDAAGTFGGAGDRRERDWKDEDGSGTLQHPRPRGVEPDSR